MDQGRAPDADFPFTLTFKESGLRTLYALCAPEVGLVRGGRFPDCDIHHVLKEISCHRFVPPGFVGAFATFSTLQAQTLNSGILEIGSSARWVSWFADFLPGQ